MPSSLNASFGPSYRQVKVGKVIHLAKDKPLQLDGGEKISNFPLAYQTYGKLNAKKSNAILIFHGLTGDQYLLGPHPVTGKPGWWEDIVGPGKILDTEKYFIICANNLGSPYGTTSAKSINPSTGLRYGLDFPKVTIRDTARLHIRKNVS